MSIFGMTGFVPVNVILPVIVAPSIAGAEAGVSARGAAARSLPHATITSRPQTTEALARLIVGFPRRCTNLSDRSRLRTSPEGMRNGLARSEGAADLRRVEGTSYCLATAPCRPERRHGQRDRARPSSDTSRSLR